jgi:hypothetical protein
MRSSKATVIGDSPRLTHKRIRLPRAAVETNRQDAASTSPRRQLEALLTTEQREQDKDSLMRPLTMVETNLPSK